MDNYGFMIVIMTLASIIPGVGFEESYMVKEYYYYVSIISGDRMKEA